MQDFFKSIFKNIKNKIYNNFEDEYTAIINIMRRVTPLELKDIVEIQRHLTNCADSSLKNLIFVKFEIFKEAYKNRELIRNEYLFKNKVKLRNQYNYENDVSYSINGQIIRGDVSSEEEKLYFSKNNIRSLNSVPLKPKTCDFDCVTNECKLCLEKRLREEIKKNIELEQEEIYSNKRRRKETVSNLNEQFGIPKLFGNSVIDDDFNADDLEDEERDKYLGWKSRQDENRNKIKNMNNFNKSENVKDDLKNHFYDLFEKDRKAEESFQDQKRCHVQDSNDYLNKKDVSFNPFSQANLNFSKSASEPVNFLDFISGQNDKISFNENVEDKASLDDLKDSNASFEMKSDSVNPFSGVIKHDDVAENNNLVNPFSGSAGSIKPIGSLAVDNKLASATENNNLVNPFSSNAGSTKINDSLTDDNKVPSGSNVLTNPFLNNAGSTKLIGSLADDNKVPSGSNVLMNPFLNNAGSVSADNKTLSATDNNVLTNPFSVFNKQDASSKNANINPLLNSNGYTKNDLLHDSNNKDLLNPFSIFKERAEPKPFNNDFKSNVSGFINNNQGDIRSISNDNIFQKDRDELKLDNPFSVGQIRQQNTNGITNDFNFESRAELKNPFSQNNHSFVNNPFIPSNNNENNVFNPFSSVPGPTNFFNPNYMVNSTFTGQSEFNVPIAQDPSIQQLSNDLFKNNPFSSNSKTREDSVFFNPDNEPRKRAYRRR